MLAMASTDPRDARIAELEAQVATLTKLLGQALKRIDELEAKLAQNSSNSSKPPSSDPPGAPRTPKEKSPRKPGGQPGHPKNERARLPADHVVPFIPETCGECGDALQGTDSDPRIHQVLEIPRIERIVYEYQSHALCCGRCGAVTRADFPQSVPSRGFGPRLTALVALLTGRYRLSKRLAAELFSDVLGTPISTGSICNLEQEMRDALEEPVREAREHIKTAPVVNMDETGWFEGQHGGRSGRAWLWLARTTSVAVFLVSESRGSDVARAMLGSDFSGLLGSDRWSGYNWVAAQRRQLCWSHLIRDFRGWVEIGGTAGALGAKILKKARPLCNWWQAVRDKRMGEEDFITKTGKVERAVVRLLKSAKACPEIAGQAGEILKLKSALFTFARDRRIEPTNNCAERAVRAPVMWRKTSFGTHSADGSRYVENILTAVTTLRLQQRPILAFLAETYTAWIEDRSPPSLLPASAQA